MTVRYAIVAFPVLDAVAIVESVRRRFDPLASMLAAHITLVFPFTSGVGDAELATHIAGAVAGQHAFDITLADISVEDGGYVFLNVEAGVDVLCELHDRLYTGCLEPYFSSAHEYRPHVTIGRLADPEQATWAAKDARTQLTLPLRGEVNQLAVFRLNAAHRGDVVCTIDLVPSPTRPAPNER
jgi:2'-5' RNA ligase